MPPFDARLFAAVMSLSFLLTACSDGAKRNFDRAAAVARVEARLAEYEAWTERYRPLSARWKKGEDVGAQLDLVKRARPQFADLEDDAVRIIDADPSDEAAFEALQVALRIVRADDMKNWEGSAHQALQERLLQVLLQHHLHRQDFLSAVYANFSTRAESVSFWSKVLDGSPSPTVRAAAVHKLTQEYSRWSSEPDLSSEERQELRRQARHFGGVLREDYAAVSPLSKQADELLAALDYSLGATLPSIDVPTVSGGVDSLSRYRAKVVLLDFWATWCAACRKDHPRLMAFRQEMAGKPFEIIGVSADEKPELVERYLANELRLPWPQWYAGPQGAVLKMWGISGYPTYLLVDGEGVIQARGASHGLSSIEEQARKRVAELEARPAPSL